MMETIINQSRIEKIKEENNKLQLLKNECSKIIVGQSDALQFILLAILCDGHVLLEGLPGVAKTTMIKTFAQAMGLTFSRIQFTPDLLPADLTGTLVYNMHTHSFDTQLGPIFANLILADEINRAPAKVQSALLEAMQEHQVTIGKNTYPLERPFLVLATQNPFEQEGTYRLPEAQVDRFFCKIRIGYPSMADEQEIVKRSMHKKTISQVISKEDLENAQDYIRMVYVDEKIIHYITNIVFATREPSIFGLKKIIPYILYGASPRATIALYQAAKAYAFLKQRDFVTPDDVKIVSPKILSHRLTLTYEADADNIRQEDIVHMILNTIPSP